MSSSRDFVIGVDGGGTKTIGVLTDRSGRELARERFPSSNPHSNPGHVVRDVLQSLIHQLRRAAGITREQLGCICLGMAGCDREADRLQLESYVRPSLDPATKLLLVNDAVVAAVASLGRLHGLLVIAGTGSICMGFNADTGQTARCGGWGHIMADEGGGYQIGREGLRAVLHEFDGRGQPTSLTPRLLRELNLQQPSDIITWLNERNYAKPDIAAIARFVQEEDAAGDAVAAALLDHQIELLVETVHPVHRKLFNGVPGRRPIGLWGGNLLGAPGYQKRFMEAIAQSGLPLDPIAAKVDAALGAATHARNQLEPT